MVERPPGHRSSNAVRQRHNERQLQVLVGGVFLQILRGYFGVSGVIIPFTPIHNRSVGLPKPLEEERGSKVVLILLSYSSFSVRKEPGVLLSSLS